LNQRRRRIEARLRLSRLAIGGWVAQTLFVATKLGVFDALNRRGPSTAAEIANELGTDTDATERLLLSLVANDLLKRDADLFANGDAAEEFLISGTPESMAGWVRLHETWMDTFGSLEESVRTGEPASSLMNKEGTGTELTREYILGMHDYALGPGRELARYLDLEGRRRLLDVAGGPGTYAIMLAEANPGLSCTVFDLPEVVRIAEELVRRHDLAERVSVHPGDYTKDDFPVGFDVVLISNALHQEDDDTCIEILKKTYGSLEPGGFCVIQAMPLNETKDGPLWPTLVNLMLKVVSRGRAYTMSEYADQLDRAGFIEPKTGTMSTFNAGQFIVARRP
jgi:SAM-dependent methyltransferase